MADRNQKEIMEQRNLASDWVLSDETAHAAMTYEEGVEAALMWILGETEDAPIEQVWESK